MTRWLLTFAVVTAAACSGGGAATPAATPQPRTDLAVFMKTRLNPPFSKLSFLLFHSEDDAEAVDPAMLPTSANDLAAASLQLGQWKSPPGDSGQARLVFFEYATSLKSTSDRLTTAVGSGDRKAAQRAFEDLRRVCDQCHHFFRWEGKLE